MTAGEGIATTNEQIAEKIQDGEDSLIPVLWDNVEKFARVKSNDWYYQHENTCIRCGITIEDLYQLSYFAFLDAVRYYKREQTHKFLTYLIYPLRNQFNEACGLRTEKQKLTPLNRCTSISLPIGSDEAITIEDTLEDKTAAGDFTEAEERIYIKQLHNVLEECLSEIPSLQADVLRARYYDNKTLEEVGAMIGASRNAARARESDGLRSLRRGSSIRRLRHWRDDIISTVGYAGSGFSSWDRTRTSSVERTVLRLEEDEMKALWGRATE